MLKDMDCYYWSELAPAFFHKVLSSRIMEEFEKHLREGISGRECDNCSYAIHEYQRRFEEGMCAVDTYEHLIEDD